MLSFTPGLRVYLAPGATDLRKGFQGLIALAQHSLEQDPLSGHLFAFCNRRRNLIKLLLWDGSGFWVLAKRLERGTYAWPGHEPGRRELRLGVEELRWILGGLDPGEVRVREWWRREPTLVGP